MSYNIIVTLRFEKELKRLAKRFSSLKNEFAQLISNATQNPETGTFIGNSCYKIRLAVSSKRKGKSGGARVITYLHIETETIYLLTIYDKGERAGIKPNDLKEIVNSLQLR